MKFLLALLLVAIVGAYFAVNFFGREGKIERPDITKTTEKPLDKYTFENLAKREFGSSDLEIGRILKQESTFSSRIFYFYVDNKKVSGVVNIPEGSGTFPVIVMFRGYVEREIYTSGVGTSRAGEVFAENRFITLAPDFLGYGESDNPSDNVMEERFQTYTTGLTLLSSIDSLNKALEHEGIEAKAKPDNVGIWGHSNGGQIAISILEIKGLSLPTVLWAPVTKPFPYSVLYYTDSFEDRGKRLRAAIAEFEGDYDVEKYSIDNFFDKIRAPLQVHQGTADEAVPQKWSDDFMKKLEDLGKKVEYHKYSGADHNLLPNGWLQAVLRSIEFYRSVFRRNSITVL